VVQILSSEGYSQILEEYCAVLKEDPEYLTYYCASNALRLQYLLKLSDMPGLIVGECLTGPTCDCCIIDALKEAIRRRMTHEVSV